MTDYLCFSSTSKKQLIINHLNKVKKFCHYLYDHYCFTLVTDHQPLVSSIRLKFKKGMPTLAAVRFQRWSLICIHVHA